MKSIRNFAYAALLTLSALNFAPTHASAQDEGGSFKLSHDVYWQNAVVPAGDYRFSLQPEGPSVMLRLSKISGTPASFMLLATDTDTVATSEPSRLVIDSKSGASYVSMMELPQFEIKLHFAAPTKAIALTTIASAASFAR